MNKDNYKKMKSITFIVTIMFLVQPTAGIAQNVIYNQNISEMNKNLKIEISSNRTLYRQGDSIIINYRIKNVSKSNQRIILKDYWEFPMGMSASIVDKNDSSICKYPTKHSLSSELFTMNDLKDFEITIKPKESIDRNVTLQNIPVFIEKIENSLLPIGLYRVSLSFFGLISNEITIEIKNNWP